MPPSAGRSSRATVGARPPSVSAAASSITACQLAAYAVVKAWICARACRGVVRRGCLVVSRMRRACKRRGALRRTGESVATPHQTGERVYPQRLAPVGI
eukprot:3467747-Prymnesium_polylepis.1